MHGENGRMESASVRSAAARALLLGLIGFSLAMLLAMPLSAQTTLPPPICEPAALPFIDILSPTSKAPGGSDFVMVIDGANFLPGAVVQFDGITLTPLALSRSRTVVFVPASAIASAHTASVKVLNPSCPLVLQPSAASNVAFFPITKQTAGMKWMAKEISTAAAGVPEDGNPGRAMAIGDFNGDGHLDLAMATAHGGIVTLLGDGHGNFAPSASSPSESGSESTLSGLEVGDFNSDGKLDLVALGGFGVRILLGDGTGSFTPMAAASTSGVDFVEGNGYCRFGVGDIDGDGRLDVVLPDAANNSIMVLLGDGKGGLAPSTSVISGFYAKAPGSVTLGDFNGDGWLDIAIGDRGNSKNFSVIFAYNNGSGVFSPSGNFGATFTGGPADSSAAGDVNGDGRLDLVTVSEYNSPPLTVLTNQGGGTFLDSLETGGGHNEVALGDLTGAGALDAIGADGADVNILTNDGNGNLYPDLNFHNVGVFGPRLGDFDEDGRLDIAGLGNFFPFGRFLIYWLQIPGVPLWAVDNVNFHNVILGGLGQMKLDTVSNSGDAPLTINSITSGPDFPIVLAATTCPVNGGTLDPGSSCDVAVNFQPPHFGDFSESLTIVDDANGVPGSTQSVALTGTATELDAFVQPPIKADGTSVFNASRGVVPVKFTLQQNGVATCQLPPATIALQRTAGGAIGPIDTSVYEMAADNGANFRIDTTACQYIYNLSARALGPGTYQVQILRDPGPVQAPGPVAIGSATFGLR